MSEMPFNLYYCDEVCTASRCGECQVRNFWQFLKDEGVVKVNERAE